MLDLPVVYNLSLAALGSFARGGFIDETAAGRVDQNGAGLHRSDLGATDHPGRLVGQRNMERDDIRHGEEFRHPNMLVRRLLRAACRIDHARAHGLEDGGQLLRDIAEADQADRLAVDFLKRFTGCCVRNPLPAAAEAVEARLEPQGRQHQQQGHLGNGAGVRTRHVADGDAGGLRRVEVYRVHADADFLDQFQGRGA